MAHSIIFETVWAIKCHGETGRYPALHAECLSLANGCPASWPQSDSGGLKWRIMRSAERLMRDGIANNQPA
jgi:hypothetical protein